MTKISSKCREICSLEKMRIDIIVGLLWIFMQAIMGLLFQDPVVCRFTESNQCYAALGQQLHLLMPLEDGFNLKSTDKTVTTRLLIKYRKPHSKSQTPNIPGWQFVNDNKTLILTSAERSNSGTYTLETFDASGTNKGSYSLQLNIKAQVSSVKVSHSCSSPGVMKVSCSADGDDLNFSWASDLNTLSQLENRNRTLILDKDHRGKVTCSVENDVSRGHVTTELHPCSMTTSTQYTIGFLVFVSVWLFLLSLFVGGLYTRPYRRQTITENQEAL